MNRPEMKTGPSTDITLLQATGLPDSPFVSISHSTVIMQPGGEDHATQQTLEMLEVPETPRQPDLDVT